MAAKERKMGPLRRIPARVRTWVLLLVALGLAPGAAAGLPPIAPPPPDCSFPVGTLAEGSTVWIPIEVGDTGPLGTEVTVRTSFSVGVVNDGPGAPPAAPPWASVDESSTVINIWDETDGSVLANNSPMPARVDPSLPFRDGCYRFSGSATVIRTYTFQPGHAYIIDARA